jgi:hypothetical protein
MLPRLPAGCFADTRKALELRARGVSGDGAARKPLVNLMEG